MKKLTQTVFLTLSLNFLLIYFSHGQELIDILDVHQADEAFILPQYDYEHIPDFTYDEVNRRVNAMSTEMPFELNETIFSFINYFTVRNRTYSKMIDHFRIRPVSDGKIID